MSVLAPTGELLCFAWPKESNQRKGHPTAACFLRSKAFTGGWQKGLPVPLPTRRIHAATLRAVPSKNFSARRGRREKPPTTSFHSIFDSASNLSNSASVFTLVKICAC